MASFLETIRQSIKRDGRTLYRLAIDSGVDVAVLQRIASGERGCNIDTAERICRVVGLDLRPARTKGR